jgi:hypothetical protein
MSGWVRIGIVFVSIFLGFVAIIAIKLFRGYAYPYVLLPIGYSVLGITVVLDPETVDSFSVAFFVAGVVLSGAACYFGLRLLSAALGGLGGARVR